MVINFMFFIVWDRCVPLECKKMIHKFFRIPDSTGINIRGLQNQRTSTRFMDTTTPSTESLPSEELVTKQCICGQRTEGRLGHQ